MYGSNTKTVQKSMNSLIIDSSLKSRLETVEKSTWEIGFLIGNNSQSKDYGVHYAPAPLKQEDKSEGIISITERLMATVAKELTRLLPGGLWICGLVIASRSSELDNCVTRLHQIMHGCFKATQLKIKTDAMDIWWHFMHMDTVSKKLTLKSLLVSDYKSTMKTGDLKIQRLDSGWIQCKTKIRVNELFHIKRQNRNDHFEKQVLDGLKHTIAAIRTATCLCDGKLYSTDVKLRDKVRRPDEDQYDNPITVTLLSPLSRTTVQTMCDETVAKVKIEGVVTGTSFHRTPVTVAQIEECIKLDLEKSLVLRCKLLCEDILQVGSEKNASEGEMVYETPPRVYLQLQGLPITFTDHMFKDETVSDCSLRARQLLGMTYLTDEQVITAEERGPTAEEIDGLFSDEQVTHESTLKLTQDSKPSTLPLSATIGVLTALVLILAALVAYFNGDLSYIHSPSD